MRRDGNKQGERIDPLDLWRTAETGSPERLRKKRESKSKSKSKGDRKIRDLSGIKESNPIAFNNERERDFVALVETWIDEGNGQVAIDTVCSRAALKLQLQPGRIKYEYLKKFTADLEEAPFVIVNGMVKRQVWRGTRDE